MTIVRLQKHECNRPNTDNYNAKHLSPRSLCILSILYGIITQENITLVSESQWYELVAPGGDFADCN